MSTPRICDNPACGDVFSEAEDGWSTAVQNQVKTDEHGVRRTVQVQIDLCPDCAGDTAASARRLREARKDRRIARLELEAGVRTDSVEEALQEAQKAVKHGQ